MNEALARPILDDGAGNISYPSLREATRTWARVALLSFGGPAGQIAVMHRIIVEEKRWVSEERFLHALNYCMLLPGPEAQQLATYIGWLMHRTLGGLVAGGCLSCQASSASWRSATSTRFGAKCPSSQLYSSDLKRRFSQ
jgi:chromate transporter